MARRQRRNIRFAVQTVSNFGVSRADLALEMFIANTVPELGLGSLLFSHLSRDMPSVLKSVSSALAIQHATPELPGALVLDQAYANAVSSLRQALCGDPLVAAQACLMMVALEHMRDSDAARLHFDAAVNLLIQAPKSMRRAQLTEVAAGFGMQLLVHRLDLDLLHLLVRLDAKTPVVRLVIDLHVHVSARETNAEDIRQRIGALEQEASYEELAILSFARILLGVSPSYHQMTFDRFQPEFVNMLDHLENSLSQDESDKRYRVEGLTISALLLVVKQCRDAALRERAISLMSRCPERQGPSSRDQAMQIARAVVEYEGDDCPEEIRAHHVLPGRSPDGARHIDIFYRPDPQMSAYAVHRVALPYVTSEIEGH
ncbi:hypothetical protein PYCC9005_003934 [Savitreella phatthalungensis]